MSSTVNIPLDDLPANTCLDVSRLSHPCRFRFMDCHQLLNHRTLRLSETPDISSGTYSAFSYVWKGNSVDTSIAAATQAFSVEGAEDGDPVSIDVLMHACTVSTTIIDAKYIWLDRVCIMQTNEEDKKWQIRNMYKIYQNSKGCIILPGGLRRLVRLDEETAWIHRGWTLQEALAPMKVVVLFAWKAGSGSFTTGDHLRGKIVQAVPDRSAIGSLRDLLDACSTGYLTFSAAARNISKVSVQVRIFGLATPNVRVLAALTSDELAGDPDVREHAIWKSAFLRTSSRPVDMVFSIMGLLGVSLDPSAFGKNDRAGATIALARELVNRGHSASWLGVALRLPPSPFLSTFPIFPRTSVEGRAMVPLADEVFEAAEMVDCEYPNRYAMGVGLPYGRMNERGYLTFTAHAIPVVRQGDVSKQPEEEQGPSRAPMTIVDLNSVTWQDSSATDNLEQNAIKTRTLAVILGWFDEYYPGATIMDNPAKIKLMIVHEHEQGQFRLISYATLNYQFRERVLMWNRQQISLGGLGDPPTLAHASRVGCNLEASASNMDRALTLARWALPQGLFETTYLAG
ncbi:hypothetical protein BDV59DRAFT_68084 [Aspergillus ambiguus]|uniref:uncharacterized protein n=1 Tax=Aspergillus ambiguus TaxID=176160 RepID=UPI003CCDF579